MNAEQRLIEVFQTTPIAEPTPDLFSRVVHSIEEDRLHRRRVVRTAAASLGALGSLIAVGAVSIQDSPGRLQGYVHRPTMVILEAVALLALVVTLGPAIRRFGRGYATDLWPRGAVTPAALLRLMDLAFYLVGVGYILVSSRFEFANGVAADRLAEQLEGASLRAGGLLLLLGLLHATTLFLLPLVALVDNSTRRAKPLPRWVILLLVLVVLGLVPFIQGAIGLALSS